MDEKKQRNKDFIRIAAFILLVCMLLTSFSYRIRPYFTFEESMRTLAKEAAPIDVLFFGGSSTLVYWAPLLAFDRYGISSYSLADSAMAPSLMMGLLEETRSICQPELYVVDIRAFENFESKPATYTEGAFRMYTDSLPYSVNRLKTIDYAGQFAQFEFTPRTHYFDFIYYHGEWRNLDKSSWEGKYSKSIELYKGCFLPQWTLSEVTLNPYAEVTERVPLSEDGMTVLTDLLDYIKSRNLPVLFLLNAYAFENEQERAIYNTIFDVIDEYGFPYLDTNMYYDEMGLNGETDFYNINHVNANGTEKYTDWLAKWLIDHYELEDHSEDSRFESWRNEMPEFNEALQKGKQHYTNQFNAKETANAE